MSYDLITCKKCGYDKVDPFHTAKCPKCGDIINGQFEDIFKQYKDFNKPKSIVDVLLEKRANK